jgi:hypothetical protein
MTIDNSVKATPIPALGNAQTAFEFRIVAAIFNFSLAFRQPRRRRETFGDESTALAMGRIASGIGGQFQWKSSARVPDFGNPMVVRGVLTGVRRLSP